MSSRLGPDYACLFVGYIEECMLSSYIGVKKGLYKRYMDDVDGAPSCGEQDLRQFLEFASSFHRHLEYTCCLKGQQDIKPRANSIATSIHY